MRTREIRFAIAVMFATVAWGQTPAGQSVERVFHFTYIQSPQAFQEVTNAIRTLPAIQDAALDSTAKTLTVSGTPAQIAMAAWLFGELDQPVPASPVTQEYRPAGSTNDVVRIFYVTNIRGPQSFQEVINAVRVIPEVTKAFPVFAQSAIVVRVTDSQAAMAEWLFHQVDLSPGMQPAPPSGQTPATHEYLTPGAADDVVRVLYLTHAHPTQSFQEIVNALRTVPELTRVFPMTSSGTVAVRGPAAKLALATWLFNQLDQPAGGQPQASQTASSSPQEFQMPGGIDDVTQVFYLAPTTTTEGIQSIVTAVRTTAKIARVYPDNALKAVTLRGTATQIASADLLIKQMDKP